MAKHIHLHMHDYGPGQNPASHKRGTVSNPYTAPKDVSRAKALGNADIHEYMQQHHAKLGHTEAAAAHKTAASALRKSRPDAEAHSSKAWGASRKAGVDPGKVFPGMTGMKGDTRDYGPGQNPNSHKVAQSHGWKANGPGGAVTKYTHPSHPGHTLEINTKPYRTDPKDNPEGQGGHGWVHQGPTTAVINPKATRNKHVKHGVASGELSTHLGAFHGG